MGRRCVTFLIEQALENRPTAAFIGMLNGKVQFHPLEDFPRMVDETNRRPKTQWWLGLRRIADALARSGPKEGVDVIEADELNPWEEDE
jgi:hypothetical protein